MGAFLFFISESIHIRVRIAALKVHRLIIQTSKDRYLNPLYLLSCLAQLVESKTLSIAVVGSSLTVGVHGRTYFLVFNFYALILG